MAGLHARGVCYLAPTPQGDERELSDEALIAGLAQSGNARLRFALAALFLAHPELAECAAQVEPALPTAARRVLRRQYLAAMYLQRMWRTRLRAHFGDQPAIAPRYLSAEESPTGAALPPPDAMHGKLGLHHLCEDSPFNDWSSYEQVVELLLNQPCGPEVLIPVNGAE
ncbi:MAG: hypothetical protein RMN25_01900 [Anaerolineae bacterium]|nr:hypothetical protein [Thermoflexales bacterium]MDW8406508.1 hypothetical protein [Anaerolineae bacterium]